MSSTGSFARVLSFVPFSSPMVMPLRIAYGDALWEVAVSVVALLAMAVVLVRIAERVYRGGVLRTQRTTGFTELFRLAR
jgi:ABC-2 type transport system permease protein